MSDLATDAELPAPWTTSSSEPPCPAWTDVLADVRYPGFTRGPVPQTLDGVDMELAAEGEGWRVEIFAVPHRSDRPNKAGNDTYTRITSPSGFRLSFAVNKKGAGDRVSRGNAGEAMPAIAGWLRRYQATSEIDAESTLALSRLTNAAEAPLHWLGCSDSIATTDRITSRQASQLLAWPSTFTDPTEVAPLLESAADVVVAVDWRKQGIPFSEIVEWSGVTHYAPSIAAWKESGFTGEQALDWKSIARLFGTPPSTLATYRRHDWSPADVGELLHTSGPYRDQLSAADHEALAAIGDLFAARQRVAILREATREEARRQAVARAQRAREAATARAAADREQQALRPHHGAEKGRQPLSSTTPRPTWPPREARGIDQVEDDDRWAGMWGDEPAAPMLASSATGSMTASGTEQEDSAFSSAVTRAAADRSHWTSDDPAVVAAYTTLAQLSGNAEASAFVDDVARYWAVLQDCLPRERVDGIPPWTMADVTLRRWYRAGLTLADVHDCFRVTLEKKDLPREAFWRYLCGVAKRRMSP